MTPKPACRCGLTLVELLVVIAIIGLLLALVLPAVQSARETARMHTCASNIRQVATAMLAHEQSRGRFPMGSINDGSTNGNPSACSTGSPWSYWSCPRQSWFPRVLPFIEAGSMVSGYDFKHSPYGSNGDSSTKGPNTLLTIFLCPSDNGVRQVAMPWGSFSLGNYPVFFSGSNLAEAHPASLTPQRRAAFGFNFGARIADIRDGTSNTMILSEYLRSTGETAPGGPDQRGMLWQADEPGGGTIMTAASPNSTTPDVFYPVCWCVNRPQANQPCVNGSTSGNDHTAAARSRHAGGVSIARADGSVSFASDRIDLVVWRGMVTIAGGEMPQGE